MFTVRQLCLLLLLVCVPSNWSSADIILSLDANGSNGFDTGTAGAGKLIQVFISQDPGATDTVAGVVADFDLQAGLVTGWTISDTGATGTPGYWGAGDLNASDLTPIDGNTAFEVNQEFASTAHPVMNAPDRELWFDITIDTTGLAAGDYTLTVRNPTGSFIDNGFKRDPD